MTKGAAKAKQKQKRAAKVARPQHDIPNKASIVATEPFTSPKGRRYTIVETNQMDPYDRKPRR